MLSYFSAKHFGTREATHHLPLITILDKSALLAYPAFFAQRSFFEKIVFAEMPVATGAAHRVVLDLGNNRLYCTCPFRPRPCLHAQALAALHAREGTAVFEEKNAPPDWAVALLGGASPGDASAARGSSEEAKAAARRQRRIERLDRAANGLDDLDRWLHDALRQGLATLVGEDPGALAHIATRMADASLPGLSRWLRLMGQVSPNRPDWAERMAEGLAQCYLAVRAFQRRSELPEGVLADLQAFLGIATRRDEVLAAGERATDHWAVLALREEPLEGSDRVRRTWLLGLSSGRFALLLDFDFARQGFPPGFGAGTVQRGALAFYPSAWPLRALTTEDWAETESVFSSLPPAPPASLEAELTRYAHALAANPWLQQMPMLLSQVVPQVEADRFWLCDAEGKALPVAVLNNTGWQLLALSGGLPIQVFGEWDGAVFLPLAVLAEGRWVGV